MPLRRRAGGGAGSAAHPSPPPLSLGRLPHTSLGKAEVDGERKTTQKEKRGIKMFYLTQLQIHRGTEMMLTDSLNCVTRSIERSSETEKHMHKLY